MSQIRNSKILDEGYRVDDLLNFEHDTRNFSEYLSTIENSSLVGLVGSYGSGKSTMMHQLEKLDSKNWIIFDAWSLPNRKDMWEGFVLSVARSISDREFENVRQKIDAESGQDLKSLLSLVAHSLNVYLPGSSTVLEKAGALFRSSPIRRVYEFEDLLFDLLSKNDSDLYIVLEDVDRAGKEGAIFLETLKQFVQSRLSKLVSHRILFIVPMPADILNTEGDIKNSYDKSLDYKHNFHPEPVFLDFLKAVFDLDDVGYSQLNDLLQFYRKSGCSIRDIKSFLRGSLNIFYQKERIHNFTPDIRMVIMIELHRQMKLGYSNKEFGMKHYNFKSLNDPQRYFGAFCFSLLNDKEVPSKFIEDGMPDRIRMPEIVISDKTKSHLPENFKDPFVKEGVMKISASYI